VLLLNIASFVVVLKCEVLVGDGLYDLMNDEFMTPEGLSWAKLPLL
jgi:hypothetical protein